ncbi:MAG: phosphotransferase family protein [Pseudomonadales bacterium]|jgi:aminoglycoside phosphotransferase (APT) family kinase protein|nr:phosphotransferase family protein [Pseudomonadales bacterium]MDP4640535.1 phosphotransferase family protein [Pseudomonadales bacterium]MDP4764795.1 phosphotransferase family protein [Pseudomonadales bacterium]MDP4874717.1 phosphotransferase family protein [Pseudomonadales bacterium]MDP4911072.1 phosphotransferase family protein [Pseudomonadales bacterium]
MAADKNDFEETLARILQARIPGCKALVKVDRLSGGASQETYRIVINTAAGEQLLAMRRAPGGIKTEPVPGHPGLDVEALLMRSARDVGVPEPQVYHVLQDDDGLGEGFIMEWLEGEALGARIARAPAFAKLRPRLAYECGKLMAKIHSVDLDATGLRQRLFEISPREFVEQSWERYQLLETPQPMIDYTARWLLEHLPEVPQMRLVHNDFRNGNFLVNEQEIVAVLDWEIAHIGDPMRDLGWICVNSWRFGADQPVGGFGSYEDLFRGYEEVSGQPVDAERVKFWEVFGSFWWSVGCLGMAEHYRSGPDKTVERPTIGRRTSECQVDCVNLLIPGKVTPVPGKTTDQGIDMPRADELLTAVRDFLRDDVMAATSGRVNFLARVAGNAVDIVMREWQLGAAARALELAKLRVLYPAAGADASLEDLRWQLTRALRDGSQALDDAALQDYLRHAVVNQIAIDQPRYSGFKTATGQ